MRRSASAGERCRGSLWLLGPSAGNAAVRVSGGEGEALFRRERREAASGWKRQEFDFVAPRTVEAAAFEIVLAGRGEVCFDRASLYRQGALDAGARVIHAEVNPSDRLWRQGP